MLLADIFGTDAFTLHSLTERVLKAPYAPGLLGALGLFEPRPINTASVVVEEKDGVLALVADRQRGAAGASLADNLRTARSFRVPHLKVDDRIMADEVLGIRAFGEADVLETVMGKVDEKLADMARSIDATVEHLRAGAVQGIIYDADGSTVIYNLFTEFGVAQAAEVAFDFGSATEATLAGDCNGIVRGIQDALGGTLVPEVHAICSSTFWDDLTGNTHVRKSFERQMDGAFLRDGHVRTSFTFMGITWHEYRGSVGGVAFVAADKAHFFPVGVPGLFREFYAPATYVEAAGTMGLPRYAKQAVDARFGEFVDVQVQSNPLPMCTRPLALYKGKRGA